MAAGASSAAAGAVSPRSAFSEQELAEVKAVFQSFDTDHSNAIDAKEVEAALSKLGMPKTPAEIAGLIKEVDKNQNGEIEFNEFLDIAVNAKRGVDTGFTRVYTKQKELIKVQGAAGSHSYAQEEVDAFALHFNNLMANDPDLKYLLPIRESSLDLCQKVADGVLLAKFINIAVKDTIDERALNKRKGNTPLSTFQMNENLHLVIQAAKSIGVKVTNVGETELMNGERFPHIVLGIIWQLVKIHLLNSINLKNHPELVRLLEPGEELSDLLKLPPDQLLLRWFNYHLKKAGHRPIANFSHDVKDSDAYTTLLNQIAPKTCDLAALKQPDHLKRAQMVLDNARRLNVQTIIKPTDICSGNPRLNLVFTAAVFNQCPGLEPLTEEEVKKAGLMDDDFGDSREERAFRMWINSLGMDDVYVNSLFDDCKDGIVLLKVIDFVEPKTVTWTKVEQPPNNKFKKVANDNYAVVLGKQLKFSLVNISGQDIEAGNKKLLLGFVWQLMRYHTLKFLSEVRAKKFGSGKAVTDDMLVEWANERVKAAGRSTSMKNFQDPSLSNGLFFLDLLHSINPKIVDWSIVIADIQKKEDALLNAKYAISVARKLGATIFLLPEDIVEVKPKMILTFVASCMAISPS